MNNIKRNILLNPGPSTTTDTVKMAQVVPDICPREKEFASLMKGLREDLVKIVHGDTDEYTAVLFTGSGTINIDVCMNSLLPEGKKVLVINNGAYSTRAVEICQYYGLDYINLEFPVDELPDLSVVEQTLKSNPDIALVHTTHNETGTGILNPIRQIGAIAHKYGAVFSVDTTSTYAMRPIDVNKDNIDFCMASAQKGLMAMTGLSYIVGKGRLSKSLRIILSVHITATFICSMISLKRQGRCILHLQYRLYILLFRLLRNTGQRVRKQSGHAIHAFSRLYIKGWMNLALKMSLKENGRLGLLFQPYIRMTLTGTLIKCTIIAMSADLQYIRAR